jgi:hypothetical protein
MQESLQPSNNENFSNEVKRTLAYYHLFNYPLTPQQLFTFLPSNSLSFNQFFQKLQQEISEKNVFEKDGYVFLSTSENIEQRLKKEKNAIMMFRIANIMTHIIKRFPFVRGVFLSGELSKNISSENGDIDYMIVTEPQRLWICRTLLIVFKKIFLLNSKKYFCLNYFVDTEHLQLHEQNIFLAAEIAHLKPLYNYSLFATYITQNDWIKKYFPNFTLARLNVKKFATKQSTFQKILELLLQNVVTSALDDWLMKKTEQIWKSRYPQFDEETRSRIFKCKPYESRAFVLNFEDKVLQRYEVELKKRNIAVKQIEIQRTE